MSKVAEGLGQTAQEALALAAGLRDYTTELLRELIAIPSPSGAEGDLARRVVAECRDLGLPARLDRCGNVIATLGAGRLNVVYDAHLDTVGPGDRRAWAHDPYQGKVAEGVVYGRGASDNKGALAAMLAGLRIASQLELPGRADLRLQLIGVVEEEVCEGWAIGEAIRHGDLLADFVVLGECTGLDVARGHRGRAEFEISTSGTACHGSSPWRGHNAIYDCAAWALALKELDGRLPADEFLGRASLAVTQVAAAAGSPNVVPETCRATVDRRTLPGETAAHLSEELQAAGEGLRRTAVRLVEYEAPSWNGCRKTVPKEFPAWVTAAEHPLVTATAAAVAAVRGEPPRIDKWEFSTDGVMTAGRLGIPTVGFGPAQERYVHTVDDQVPVDDLVKAAAVYAVLPLFLAPRV